jgi:hypothetical protein
MAFTSHCVLICGYARAGKDTFAKGLIAAAQDATRVAYADPIKYALELAAHTLGLGIDYHDDAEKAVDRPLLVEFGRAMRRRDKDIFARQIEHNLISMKTGQTLVVSDWRYLNEYAVAKQFCDQYAVKLHTVQIVRHGWIAANEEEAVNMQEVIDACPIDETVFATSGDEESVLMAGIRTAKLWNL